MSLVAYSDDPLLWERITCGGRLWPGLVRVEGCERTHDWQVNKAKGSEGASTSLQGAGLAEPKITFELWKGWDGLTWVDYFAEWDSYKEVFEATVAGKDPTAIVIEHPQFAHNRIRGCSLKKMGDVKLKGDGSAEVTVELIEFKKPKPKLGSPKAAGGGKTSPAKPGERPKSDVELEIDRLNKENAKLLTELKS